MPSGTGLDRFGKAYPARTFDVGIAEQHAVTFAAGLAAEGYKPFCAIYSTFLQRGYDQLVHDVAIQNLPVRFAIDRAGLVGRGGAAFPVEVGGDAQGIAIGLLLIGSLLKSPLEFGASVSLAAVSFTPIALLETGLLIGFGYPVHTITLFIAGLVALGVAVEGHQLLAVVELAHGRERRVDVHAGDPQRRDLAGGHT